MVWFLEGQKVFLSYGVHIAHCSVGERSSLYGVKVKEYENDYLPHPVPRLRVSGAVRPLSHTPFLLRTVRTHQFEMCEQFMSCIVTANSKADNISYLPFYTNCFVELIVLWSALNISIQFNPLNPELNPICYLLALLGAHHFLHVSRIRVKSLTFRLLMS